MGNWSIRLFRIFGIELEVHLTFFLVWAFFAVIGWSDSGWQGAVWMSSLLFLIFTCVVLHELGHSLTAQGYGIRVSRILLLPIGGMAQFEKIPRDPRKEIFISLAGPAVNLVIICVLLPFVHWPLSGIGRIPLDAAGLIQTLLLLNAIMALFNLLPIFPMDGGRVLRAFLATRLPYLKATAIATGFAKGLVVAGVIVAIFQFRNPFLVFLLAFIYLGGDMEYRMVKRREKMSGLFVRDLTRKHYLSIAATSTLADAKGLFDAFHPGEILVMEGEVPCGYLTGRIVRDASKRNHLNEPASLHCVRKFSVLQAGWPLDPFAEMISQSSQRLYPVYSFGTLVGVVDTKNLENLIAWHRLQAMAEHNRIAPRKDAEVR